MRIVYHIKNILKLIYNLFVIHGKKMEKLLVYLFLVYTSLFYFLVVPTLLITCPDLTGFTSCSPVSFI